MIDSLHIKNFQAHSDLKLEFDPHVTTIVGRSDVGKSAIIRALRWVVTNQPSGLAYIKHGTKEAQAILTVDGKRIVRERSKTKNSYDCESTQYNAIGTDIPDKVSNLLKIGDVNFQQQHDAPFWFSETAGEVSRQLNRLVDLEIIDASMGNAARTLAECRAAANESETRLIEAKSDRKRLRFVPRLCADYDAIRTLEIEMGQTTQKCVRLNGLVVDAESSNQRVKNSTRAILGASRALVGGDELVNLAEKVSRLRILTERVADLSKTATIHVPNISGLESLSAEVFTVRKQHEKLTIAVKDFERKRKEIWDIKSQLEASRSEFQTEIGDVCPLCNQPINR
uniref:Putative ATPase domain containing protein n=1 Tax=viral metagenome TaxID=1070528 RepID=A0A6M3IWJ4_9ZZZZ